MQLDTAGDKMAITHTADCEVTPGLDIRQGWIAPCMDVTLIPLAKDGWLNKRSMSGKASKQYT